MTGVSDATGFALAAQKEGVGRISENNQYGEAKPAEIHAAVEAEYEHTGDRLPGAGYPPLCSYGKWLDKSTILHIMKE